MRIRDFFHFFVIRCGNVLSIRYSVEVYLLQYLLGHGGEILLYVTIKAAYVYLQGQVFHLCFVIVMFL